MSVLTRTNYISLPLILGSSISHLLAQGSPSNVSRLIVAIVVDAVKGVLGCRFASDLFQELFKRVEPKLNPPAPVDRMIFIVGPVTPVTSIVICSVFGGSALSPVIPMDQKMVIMTETSATLGVIAGKIISKNSHNVTTVTEAIPPRLSVPSIVRPPDNCESGEFLTYVNLGPSHAVRPPSAYGLWLGSMGYLSNPSSRRDYSMKGGT